MAWSRYADARLAGSSRAAACKQFGIAPGSAALFDRGDPKSSGHNIWRTICRGRYPFSVEEANANLGAARVIPSRHSNAVKTTCLEARLALEDFDLFRRRYLGEISRPWHVTTAEAIVERYHEPGRSYLVINAAPGGGKSTLIRAAGAWMTVRDRTLRAARMSNVTELARREVRLMRRHFERHTPLTQKADQVSRGLACDAVATLVQDYGAFRPENRDLWTSEAFVVLQDDGVQVSEKEPTWSAYGMDSAIIGNRFELMLGDDLDTPRSVRQSAEVRAATFDDWDNEVETRLEPDGLIGVVGQRLSVKDIYRYLKDKRISPDDAEVLDLRRHPDGKQYVQITFPAHDDIRCQSNHRRDAPALGEEGGCLLDPYRVPWRQISNLRENRPDTFYTVYQQEEGRPGSGLVDPAWIHGGKGFDGLTYTGCYDDERKLWQLPAKLGPGVGVVQVDPSGSQYWAVQAWYYVPPAVESVTDETLGHTRILLDVRDAPMEAPDLLDWNHASSRYHGILEEWHGNYARLGVRLAYVVVEINAAQRYLLQFEHAKRWCRDRQVVIRAHTTGIRKLDEQLGVYALKAPYRFGLVRLPGGDSASLRAVAPLVEQVTRWPDSRREDQVMAQWFGEANLSLLAPTNTSARNARPWRPSWALRGSHENQRRDMGPLPRA